MKTPTFYDSNLAASITETAQQNLEQILLQYTDQDDFPVPLLKYRSSDSKD